MDKSIYFKEIQDNVRELKTLANIIDGQDQCKMRKKPTTIPSTERRILAFKENTDGTITKFYTLRKTIGPEKLAQNPSSSTASYSMKEYCPPSGRTPYLPANVGSGMGYNPKVGSTQPQGRRCPPVLSPSACAKPPFKLHNLNPRPSPPPLSESALEKGAWGPKPQPPCPRTSSPTRSVDINRILKSCQKVRGIPLPPCPPLKSPYLKPSSSAEPSESENDYEYDQSSGGSSPYKLPSYGSSPCGDPIAPICMNRGTGAIPKNPFKKRPLGPPPPAIPPSPVNIIFMTPYQLTESGLLNGEKQTSYKQLPCAIPSSNVLSCSEQPVPAPRNGLNITCGEATPRKPTARRKLLFDSCDDDCPTAPVRKNVKPTCPRSASKTVKCCSAQILKSCLKKLLSKNDSSCHCSEESDDDDDNEDCDDDDGDGGGDGCGDGGGDGNQDDQACELRPSCRPTPKECMKKITVITRKNEFGKEVNEIIEEDFFPDNCDGAVCVKNIVKGIDPSDYLERRIAQFQKKNTECDAPKKEAKKKSKCCSCDSTNTKAIENGVNEEPEDQTLNEVINTTIKSFELIADVIMKRPLVRCVSNLPSDNEGLNKVLQESINRTESSMSLLRKNLTDALAELSTIFARRAKKTVPEIEDLIKHFEKRMCPESDGGQRRSSKSTESTSKPPSEVTSLPKSTSPSIAANPPEAEEISLAEETKLVEDTEN